MLDDGTYDAVILDATEGVACDGRDVLHLELTIVAGRYKGEVVSVAAVGLGREVVDVMGLPATLDVTAGEPRITFD